ncbi:hypothetical protein EJD97_002551 [Solanum chilense]|uniref:Glutathione S-transferase n=1 Tax=Solanum chilense TaxID=4083 RepID=A0A6N2BWX6_SOLCI|nr:hypothetical protein EJD97_002551 [Solanum chilense]
MATSIIKVLGTQASPFTNRVSIALNVKSVDYEFVQEDISNKSELLKSNPVYKKIPVLIHGEKTICESLVIVQYIDETWTNGPSVLPSNPLDRAITRFWAAYIDDKWLPLMSDLGKAQGKSNIRSTRETTKSIGAFRRDIALGCILGWIKAIKIILGIEIFNVTKTPGLVNWGNRFLEDKCVKGAMLEPEKLVEILNLHLAKKGANNAN